MLCMRHACVVIPNHCYECVNRRNPLLCAPPPSPLANKKVLLRKRKRHTARRVVEYSFCCPTRVPPRGGYLTWVPPPRGGTWPGHPPGGVPDPGTPPGGVPDPGTPRGGYLTRVPPPGGSGFPPAASWHSGKCCKALWDMGTPPCGQTDWWMDRRVSKHYLPSYYVRGR